MRELGGHNGTADAASEVRGPRRRFLAVAVPDYGDRDEEFTRGIAEQLDVLHAWWCDASLGGDRFTPHTAPPPAGRRDVENFLHEVGVRDAGPEDVLVLCIAGHGVTSPSGQHFLRLPRTRTGRLHTTAYRTADLLAACLDSRAGHVLAIVNTCEAGAVEAELAQLRKDLGARRRREAGLTVLATSDFQETVRVRALAVLLQRVHCQLRTSAEIVEPLLTVDEFAYELDRAARRTPQPGALPRLLLEPADRYAPSPCLPNPGHRPPDDVVAPQRQPVAARRAELDFWVGRAAGAESGDAGWYFSGRRGHTKVLADFLAASAPGGALLVTGPAGSGKSALIARAVTLADPGFRQDPRYAAALRDTPPETMPPPGAVDVAVLARQMETRIIIEGLLAGLGREPAPPGLGTDRVEQLREELRGRERPTTLVIDGLDEAHHPADVVSRLLAPLAPLTAAGPTGRPALRLVVGVRSPEHAAPEAADGLLPLVRRTLAAHGEPAELRTDTADTAEDIAAYVQALLSPLREGVSEIAGTIAAATSPSFLDARLAAEQLRPPHDALEQFHSPQWRASLGAGTVGLLRRDLADTGSAELPRDTALALLRASAFAQGAGIPWADVWPAVAQAVAGRPVPDADRAIAALLGGRLAGYLTRDTEDGRAVHRPAHARLAEVLREAPHLLAGAAGAEEQPLTGGTDEAAVHRRIAARLAELGTAGAGGLAPHPYVRRHLVRHAALGGALDDAAVPASLLAHESSGTVRAQLGLPVSADAGRTWLAAWARVEPFLLGADAASRASSLHLAHYALTATAGAPDVSPVAGTCIQPLWSAWHVPGNVLARTATAVNDLATVPGPGGCTLLAGALEDGTVGVWDAATGAPLGPPRAGHDGHVRAVVAVSPAEGPPLLVSAGADAVARCRDPLAGIPAGAPLSLGDGPVTALAALGDGTLFAAAGHGPRVRVWDPFADREARAFPTGHPGGVRALAAFPGPDGRERLATAGWDGVVRQWDPLTGGAAGPALTGHAGSVAAVAAFADGPRTLLATGGVDGTLRLWDPATGSPHGPPRTGHVGPVRRIAGWHRRDGRVLLATAGADGTVRAWDPSVAPTPPGLGPVAAVAALRHGFGGLLLATGGDDGMVRVWDPVGGREAGPPLAGHRGAVTALAGWHGRGQPPLLASGGQDGTVRVWDPVGGAPTVPPLEGHAGPVRSAVAFRDNAGRPLLATAGDDGPVRLWDPLRGREAGPVLPGHADGTRAVTAVPGPDDCPWLATCGWDGSVRLWDPLRGREAGPVLPGPATALAGFGSPGGVPRLAVGGADGSLSMWDPVTGRRVAQVSTDHAGEVAAVAVWASPDGRLLLAGAGADGLVTVGEWETGVPLLRLALGSAVRGMSVLPPDAKGRPAVLAVGGAAGAAAVALSGLGAPR